MNTRSTTPPKLDPQAALRDRFRARRLETIGMLSSGIAHDLNNLLGTILMRSQMAEAEAEALPQVCAALSDIQLAGLRARALVRRIMSFSHREEQERRLLDLREVLREAARLASASVPSNVTVRFETMEDCPQTVADETQLHQVFANLASNAAAAMPGGGVLSFRLGEATLAAPRTFATGVVAPGRYLTVSVSDTGSGIDEETLKHVFEPFFTTRSPSEGTGLGLSIVESVMAEHCGGIHVASAPGAGSTFTLFLPVVTSAPLQGEKLPTARGNESVLIVDDDEDFASRVQASFEALGYRVGRASSSQEFLHQMVSQRTPYDLLFVDLETRDLGGIDFARRTRAAWPDLPMLMVLSFTTRLDAYELLSLGGTAVLENPLELTPLAHAVRRLLDADRQRESAGP